MTYYKKRVLINFIIAFAISAVGFCLVFFLRQVFSLTGWADAFLVAGALTFFGAVLVWITRFGTFDTLGYGFHSFIATFKAGGERRYKTIADYKQAKLEKREKQSAMFFPYLIVGGFFLLMALLFTILAVTLH